MSRAIAVAVSVVLSTLALPCAAQLDIVSQDIAIDASGPPDQLTVTIDATLEATATASDLLFYKPMAAVTSATIDGQPVTVTPHPSYPEYLSRVVLAQPIPQGTVVAFHLELGGTPNCTVTGYPGVFCVRTSEETLLTPSMPGAGWYLLNAFESDTFVATISVRAADAHTVAAGIGPADSIEPNGDGTTTHHFSVPIEVELLAAYAGTAETTKVTEGFPVTVIHHPRHDAEKVAFAGEVTSKVLPILESYYGDLPIQEARIVIVPDNFAFGGLGIMGMVLINELVVGPADYLIEQGMAHEFSHSWWGNLATGSDPIEVRFLGESFAEYSGWKALGELRGDALRTSGMRMNAVWYMYRRPMDADVPVISAATDSSPAAIHVLYHKGPLVLRTVEEAAGPEAYAKALRAFVARGHGGLSLDAFVADVADASGYDATHDVDQWLKKVGFPRVTVQATRQDGAVQLSLSTEGDFTFGLPLRMIASDGTIVDDRIELAPGAHEFTVDGDPVAVEIDPRWTAVREINPALAGDVTLDGEVDGADLVATAVSYGGELPMQRRVDGGYDPLFDLDRDGFVGDADLELIRTAVAAR